MCVRCKPRSSPESRQHGQRRERAVVSGLATRRPPIPSCWPCGGVKPVSNRKVTRVGCGAIEPEVVEERVANLLEALARPIGGWVCEGSNALEFLATILVETRHVVPNLLPLPVRLSKNLSGLV